jgi:hypothetical protein
MTTRQRYSTSSLLKRFSILVVTLTLLLLPCNVFADDTTLLMRIVDELDMAKLATLKDVKLSAVVNLDEKGDIVVSCLNLSLPVAHNPFNDNAGMRKLMQRTRLQVDSKGKGVMVKLAFAF